MLEIASMVLGTIIMAAGLSMGITASKKERSTERWVMMEASWAILSIGLFFILGGFLSLRGETTDIKTLLASSAVAAALHNWWVNTKL